MSVADVFWTTIESPIGTLRLIAAGDRLAAVYAPSATDSYPPLPTGARNAEVPVLTETHAQLTAYFAGERTAFDLPLAPEGAAPFRQRVWDALVAIPYGQTTTYGAIAHALGDPTASRAVGSANGSNPLLIIVPCHRVIGAGGDLTGYGAGLPRKRALLAFEAATRSRGPGQAFPGLEAVGTGRLMFDL
jgi:methylated-DNA-[protein]-cysteine S-methyltransferase